jgi:hypothetical protein
MPRGKKNKVGRPPGSKNKDRPDHSVELTANELARLAVIRDRLHERLGFKTTPQQAVSWLIRNCDQVFSEDELQIYPS